MFCDTLHLLERKWLAANANDADLRFGQWFINNYVKRGTLFHEETDLYEVRDVQECRISINEWLVDNQYQTELPPKVV